MARLNSPPKKLSLYYTHYIILDLLLFSPFLFFFLILLAFVTTFTGNEQSWLSIARASYALRFKSGLTTV